MALSAHTKISFVKSGLRLAAYGVVILFAIAPIVTIVFGALFLAEIIGVIEEFRP